MRHPAYRPDVDGLRAVAVLAVLAYHAFPHSAPGGFAGVDVFFVISGFLITGIILDGLKDGSFTFADFYWRRVRRIFPALILVLAFSLLLGWLLLLPDEFAMLGKHVAAGAGFVSNIVFWREAGYFDAAAELKPLLHLWSLGVEEQYYFVWPLLLFLFRKDAKRMLGMMLALAAVSFAANVLLIGARPEAAFYLPLTRFWELMAGGLLAFFGLRQARHPNVTAIAGAGLLALSFGLLDGQRDFPGWWALLPVAGSALLISAGPAAWINRNLLASRAMVYAGLISYPLYLWHWPLLSYARIVHGGEPPAALRWGLLAAAVVLSVLTYELVEKKIRFARLPVMRRISFPALAASLAVAGIAGLLALQSHLQPRSASVPLVLEISSASADWSYSGDRVIPGDTEKAVLFFGDSHMQHYWPRIEKIVRERAAPLHTVMFKTTGGCAPVPGIERRSQQCGRFVEEGLRLARRPEVETVVIAASWVGFVNRTDYYKAGDPEHKPLKMLAPESAWVLQGFEAELKQLTAAGKQVVLVLSSPRGAAFDPKSVIQREGMTVQVRAPLGRVPRSELVRLTSPIDSRLIAIAAAAGASLIDPTEYLCSRMFCPAADERGRPLYKDASHLRASYVRERFSAVDRFVFVPEGDL